MKKAHKKPEPSAQDKLAAAINNDTYDLLDFAFEPDSVLMDDDFLTHRKMSIGHIWRGRLDTDNDGVAFNCSSIRRHPHSAILVVDDRLGDVRNVLAEELLRVGDIYVKLAALVRGGGN